MIKQDVVTCWQGRRLAQCVGVLLGSLLCAPVVSVYDVMSGIMSVAARMGLACFKAEVGVTGSLPEHFCEILQTSLCEKGFWNAGGM